MRVRSKAILASTAIIAAVAVSACGQMGNLQAQEGVQGRQHALSGAELREAADQVRGSHSAAPDSPEARHGLLLPGQQLRQPVQAGPEGRSRERRVPDQGHRKLQDFGREARRRPDIKKLALDYLVGAYGPDKLNDPAQAEPIVQRMIQLDPSDTTNYFVLAKIYEDAGNIDEAEAMLMKAGSQAEGTGGLPAARRLLPAAGRVRQADRAVQQRAELEPNNPEAHYAMATYYWDEAYRNTRLNETTEARVREERARRPSTRPRAEPDYVEALTYQGPAAQSRGRHGEGRGPAEGAPQRGRRSCRRRPSDSRRSRRRGG